MKTQFIERRQGGAEARAKAPALRAGQPVTLRNGQRGKAQFVSAAMKCARVVMSDGKTMRTVKLTEIAPLGDVSRPTLHKNREGWGTRGSTRGEGSGARLRPTLRDIDPEEGFDEQEEFEERKPEIRRTVERAHPVAGQKPMVSDRVTARAERSIDGPPKPVKRKDLAKVGKKDSESGRRIVQPSDSIRAERAAGGGGCAGAGDTAVAAGGWRGGRDVCAAEAAEESGAPAGEGA